jgi:hypothetical protein
MESGLQLHARLEPQSARNQYTCAISDLASDGKIGVGDYVGEGSGRIRDESHFVVTLIHCNRQLDRY